MKLDALRRIKDGQYKSQKVIRCNVIPMSEAVLLEKGVSKAHVGHNLYTCVIFLLFSQGLSRTVDETAFTLTQ